MNKDYVENRIKGFIERLSCDLDGGYFRKGLKDVNNITISFEIYEPNAVPIYWDKRTYKDGKSVQRLRIVPVLDREVLDDVEKEYLGNIIGPFRDKVKSIEKVDCFDGDMYIMINLLTGEDIELPMFNGKTGMYEGMMSDYPYAPDELGL